MVSNNWITPLHELLVGYVRTQLEQNAQMRAAEKAEEAGQKAPFQAQQTWSDFTLTNFRAFLQWFFNFFFKYSTPLLIIYCVTLALSRWKSGCFDPQCPYEPNGLLMPWETAACTAVFENYLPENKTCSP